MDLKKLSKVAERLETKPQSMQPIVDMARLNLGETQVLPYNAYDLVIWSNDHNPPHFHVLSKQEGFNLRYDFDGNFLSVELYGKRTKSDNFSDITKMVNDWLESKPVRTERYENNKELAKDIWNLNN